MSIASRGLTNTKIDLETKQLRYVSCYGLDDISPCHFLRKSKNSQYFYCGGCGCGDHSHTWLVKQKNEYSKLDYPSLNCPLKMPGFTNYDPGFTPQEVKNRKEQIESLDPQKLSLVQITVNSDAKKEKDIENIINVIKNS